jgi:uncharacterized lipoprotein YehR (DUF1307 family)
MTFTSFAKKPDDIKYTFTQTDSTYSFSGSFTIKANSNCLLDICFQHEHISALAPDAKEVLIKDQGNDWNQISYTYQKFIYFENKSVWNRKLDKENMRVDFTLISSKNNHAIMPRMVSSSGYYQISMQDEEIIVKYFQECQLTKSSITNLYLNRVKKEALQFMHRFLEYANTICNNSLLDN